MDVVAAIKQPENSRRGGSERTSQRIFFGIATLLFVVSTITTIRWCTGMSMDEMPMPGGWTMSMTWMRMCGQTWTAAATSFVAMWVAMMAAMMLPSLTPTLWRYYRVANPVIGKSPHTRRVQLTLIVAFGYFVVWGLLGLIVFPVGVLLATMEMRSSALASIVPIAAGLVVLIAGALQFTDWKAHRLACCRIAPKCHLPPATIVAAGRYGLRLGFHCLYCCAGPTAILLVIGVMDLRAMALVTVAITIERLAATAIAARIIGVVIVAAGLHMIVLAAGLA